MTKESIIELQKIDCNCNDCSSMVRDIAKYRSFDSLYTNEKGQVTSPAHRINYGFCSKFKVDVSFIPGTCQIENQLCFTHRRETPNLSSTK